MNLLVRANHQGVVHVGEVDEVLDKSDFPCASGAEPPHHAEAAVRRGLSQEWIVSARGVLPDP